MKNKKIQMLVEGAIMVALATALSYVQLFKLPWGGTITLLSMLPITVFSVKWGVKAGVLVSVLYSLIQLLQGIMIDGLLGWGLTPVALVACIFLDYVLAFSVLGLAGTFRKKGVTGWLGGITAAIVLRYISHLISGAAIFHSVGMLWEGFVTDNEWIYSAVYNACYMLPELLFTIIGAAVLLNAPVIKKYIRPMLVAKTEQ